MEADSDIVGGCGEIRYVLTLIMTNGSLLPLGSYHQNVFFAVADFQSTRWQRPYIGPQQKEEDPLRVLIVVGEPFLPSESNISPSVVSARCSTALRIPPRQPCLQGCCNASCSYTGRLRLRLRFRLREVDGAWRWGHQKGSLTS